MRSTSITLVNTGIISIWKEQEEASGCPFLLSGLSAGSFTFFSFHASDHRRPIGMNADHGVGYCPTATPQLMAYGRRVYHSFRDDIWLMIRYMKDSFRQQSVQYYMIYCCFDSHKNVLRFAQTGLFTVNDRKKSRFVVCEISFTVRSRTSFYSTERNIGGHTSITGINNPEELAWM